jgi:hypothetical protein
MARIEFNRDQLSRQMTRTEWRKLHRWRRLVQGTIAKYDTDKGTMAAMRDMLAFGGGLVRLEK